MNELTRTILTPLLQDKRAWKWEGKPEKSEITSPNIPWIQHNYWRTWDALWVETVYLDQMFRAYRLFKTLLEGGVYKDNERAASHFGTALIDGEEQITVECERCMDDLQHRLCDGNHVFVLAKHKGRPSAPVPFVDWWLDQHPEWRQEEINESLIEQIKERPNLVDDKVLKDGSVQRSML